MKYIVIRKIGKRKWQACVVREDSDYKSLKVTDDKQEAETVKAFLEKNFPEEKYALVEVEDL